MSTVPVPPRLDLPVMLAQSFDPARVRDWAQVAVEPKLDGVRIVVQASASGRVRIFSRNGRPLEMFSHLDEALRTVASRFTRKYGTVMFDGEMVDKSGSFEAIGGAIHRKDATVATATAMLFFVMPWDRFLAQTEDEPQQYRMLELAARWTDAGPMVVRSTSLWRAPSKDVWSADTVLHQAAYWQSLGLEGAMVKQIDAPYVGRRSYDWLKVKAQDTADVVVVGMEEGKGKYAGTLGKLLVQYKGQTVGVSGMTDAQRKEWWRYKKRIIGKVVEVAFQHETDKGSLRHPRFVRVREDKSPSPNRSRT